MPVAEATKTARRQRRTNGVKPASPPVTIETNAQPMPTVPAQPPSISPLLLSGVFVGGTVPLLPGSRYSLVVEDGELKVLGPVDIAPNRTVVSRPAVGIEIDSIGDRLTIAQRGGRATGIGLVFTAVVGASAGQLEQAIATAEATEPTPNRATLQ
jgi:hypothetical protein